MSSPQGRFEDGAKRVDGRVFRRAEAWGKHLFERYEGGLIVHVHLGLYGKFSEVEGQLPEPVGQVRMRMQVEDFGADLRGAITCEVLHKPEVDALTAKLGPDPLRRGADSALAFQRLSRSQRSIASLLMDQSVVAGVGNVYRAEVLHRHGISPHRPGTGIDAELWDAMWTDLATMMRIAVRRGKIVTIRRPHDRGAPAYAEGRARTYVYRRAGEPCRICGTPVLHQELEGRNLFWCPTCQPD